MCLSEDSNWLGNMHDVVHHRIWGIFRWHMFRRIRHPQRLGVTRCDIQITHTCHHIHTRTCLWHWLSTKILQTSCNGCQSAAIVQAIYTGSRLSCYLLPIILAPDSRVKGLATKRVHWIPSAHDSKARRVFILFHVENCKNLLVKPSFPAKPQPGQHVYMCFLLSAKSQLFCRVDRFYHVYTYYIYIYI